MSRHRVKPERRGIWVILKESGIVIIVLMGIGLIALAIGVAFGTRMIP